MLEQVRSNGLQLPELEGASAATETAWAPAESDGQPLAASESVFQGDVTPLMRFVGGLEPRYLECVKS